MLLVLIAIGLVTVIIVVSCLTFFEWLSRQVVKFLDKKEWKRMFNSIKSICKCILMVFSANVLSMLGVLIWSLIIIFIMKMQDISLTDNTLRLMENVSYIVGALIDFMVIYCFRKVLLEYEAIIVWTLKLLIYFNGSVFCGIVGIVFVCMYWYLVYIKKGDDMYV